MENIISLCDLSINSYGTVTEIKCKPKLKNRMSDLGLYEGAEVCPVMKSPFDDPRAYKVNDTLIALRNSDAKQIKVKPGD